MTSRILLEATVVHHSPTGRTRHTFNGVEVSPATSLRIVQFDTDPGYYLIHLDNEGREVADTYHDTIDDAIAQAEWEFGLLRREWKSPE